MEQPYSPVQSRPIAISQSTEAQVYGLFAVAMALTVLGVFIGMQYAPVLLTTGLHFFFLFAELGLIFTAGLWMNKSPLNYLLFGLFPLISGFTITPYILSVLTGYANGGSILLNALSATGFMAAFPSLQTSQFELMLSGVGVVIFALFMAYDLQRIEHLGKMGAHPMMLALSLYLDIFNLFLYILRFMIALSGDRR
ncbi:MAG: hypothetical protein UY90_C0073G0006 [Candidatus Peregrinibacteria bacterium GW2011_GWA2_54_9]|nr:MAG: hypothetical protein UY90_C0073G0006 [Candidatus Peregrinibacteria bacterium GW2011_GWA2_54_9]